MTPYWVVVCSVAATWLLQLQEPTGWCTGCHLAAGVVSASQLLLPTGRCWKSAALLQEPEQRMFKDSIESLLRNEIQQHKIDMANEIIDAGRFNMKTTNAERRDTLEEMLKVTHAGAFAAALALLLYPAVKRHRCLLCCIS